MQNPANEREPVTSNDTAPAPPSRPIFDVDISCPHCEYNLRGLTEARCPECGLEFDPAKLLTESEMRSKPSPSVWWTLANILSHPVDFWRMPRVENTAGPKGWYMFWVLVIAGIELAPAFVSLPRTGIGSRIEYCIIPSIHIAGPAALAGWFAAVFHMILCLPAMPRRASPNIPTGASAIVGYASAWIIPAMAGFLTVTTAKMARLNSGLIVTGCVLLLVSCLLWMITLYAGAMTITHGKRIASLWCTASNPFWYAAILSLWLR